MSNTYTVVGLRSDSDWSHGMREASFVTFVNAMSPTHAGLLASREMGGADPDDVVILAVLEGCHDDRFDPGLQSDETYMAELDRELAHGSPA